MFLEYVRQAWRALATHRMRSLLTVLSITIGVLSVILLTSVAQSGLSTLSKGIEEMGGARLIMLWQDSPKKAARKQGNYTKGLTLEDAHALRDRVPNIARMAPVDSGSVTVRTPGGEGKKTDRVGTDETFLATFGLELAAGRDLDSSDLAEQRRVCVIGDELAKKLMPGTEAVGQELVLENSRYRVVGRLKFKAKSGMHFGFDWNDLAVVPLPLTQPTGRAPMLFMNSADPARNTELLDRANALLLARHNGVDDFQFLDFNGMLKGYYAVFFGMILIVGLISGMSLVIGGVGIMNIMLVAVAERRREIGLRKAVGAHEGAIMQQFLIESTVLSLFGAVIGTVLGLGLSYLAAVIGPVFNKGWVGITSYPAVVLAVLAAGGIGLFFGWYPARQAARLDPILCLRAE